MITEMTLAELLEKHGPGCKLQRRGVIFFPYFLAHTFSDDSGKQVVGVDDDDYQGVYTTDSTGWTLYVEPKQKVVRWLWIYEDSGEYKLSMIFRTDEEASTQLNHLRWFRKIEGSAQEFEE